MKCKHGICLPAEPDNRLAPVTRGRRYRSRNAVMATEKQPRTDHSLQYSFRFSCPARRKVRRRLSGRPGTRTETRLKPIGPQHLCGRYQATFPNNIYNKRE
ncbi:hypothetical protein [Lacrimispora sp.]|uniref:hypothetical protein n=1 Tax=Lacrimispora sp. TaxID=2719234 RepID=UPI00286678FF|nr:hypothetical protein [Lacrimispora sp.]MDR7813877.1 hypothetical protein [Lacrimispora sp.]